MKSKVGFIEAFRLFWKNYFNFTGRASRREFWFMMIWHVIFIAPATILINQLIEFFDYTLVTAISGTITSLIAIILTLSYLMLYSLATFIPTLSILIRRYHDTGRTKLVPIISFGIYVIMMIFIYIMVFRGISLSANAITLLTKINNFFMITLGIYNLVICCLRSERKIQEK
ncbi:DUF805 domain-containing protein [Staphylococcus caeli]|uniref:Membrane protein n=1 Tax=Staphylococcus caeli TaxID=2201815 RepID=A0A1D4L000_9STAP|nr:DUF805 domain-containing protein [Staphylococcus caeli]SCS69234.1 membrane protein [Staphylococcus caeli]SCS79317.1 membrane protein [Staphylococcus caeli]